MSTPPFTARQLAHALGIGRRTMERIIAGGLPTLTPDRTRGRLYDLEAARRWIAEHPRINGRPRKHPRTPKLVRPASERPNNPEMRRLMGWLARFHLEHDGSACSLGPEGRMLRDTCTNEVAHRIHRETGGAFGWPADQNVAIYAGRST